MVTFQSLSSANFEYIRNSSAAKRADSSPPVPALISTITFFLSRGSFGTSSFFSSSVISVNFGSSSSSSDFAISASSLSVEVVVSFDSLIAFSIRSYFSIRSIVPFSSLCSLEIVLSLLGSEVIEGFWRSLSSSLNFVFRLFILSFIGGTDVQICVQIVQM